MAEAPVAGARAPSFTLPSTEGSISLDALTAGGHRVVLAFYTEDGTPSCEGELTLLRESHELLTEFGARVVAVSADSIDSHRAFAERMGGVPFPLAADLDLSVARAYGVADEEMRRSRRAIFVIERDGAVLLALPHFQPGNVSQIEGIFMALGGEE